jgi:hypothetical protein
LDDDSSSPFRAIRSCSGEALRYHVLEVNPEKIQPAISVQREWNQSWGIIRGMKEGSQLVEDHITEILDDEGRLNDAGRRIFGADEIRRQFWTVGHHLAAYALAHPENRIVAWVGNGNLLSNPRFVARAGGELFCLRGELEGFRGGTYSCLAVRRAGASPRVSIESIDLRKPLPDDLEYFTSGQRLVQDGKPLDTDRLVSMASRMEFYDLRHLFLFGRVQRGDKRWIDVGLSAFWDEGRLNLATVEHAIRGGAIEADVSQFDTQEVREAMEAKDYSEAAAVKTPGQFSIQGNRLRVILLEGVYPHSMIGIRDEGTVLSVVVSGLSNRAGVTIRGAAQLMSRLGARDALLIDNGGDVMMSFRGRIVLGSAEDERNRMRSILLYRHHRDCGIEEQDARLVSAAPQHCLPLT